MKRPRENGNRVPKTSDNYYTLAWEQNFYEIIKGAEKDSGEKPLNSEFYLLYLASCKKFMAEAIYYLKSPENNGLKKLIEMHLKEYKLYLADEFSNISVRIHATFNCTCKLWVDL